MPLIKKVFFCVSELADGTDLEICCDDPSGEQGSVLFKAPSGEDAGRTTAPVSSTVTVYAWLVLEEHERL